MKVDIKTTFYKDGYDLTIENVKSLMRISQIASETGDFGIACSLNILAAEECLKALFLIIKHYNPEHPMEKFEKIFRYHNVKHEELKGVVEMDNAIQKENDKVLASLDFFIPVFDKMKALNTELKDEDIAALKDDYEWFKKLSEKKLNFDGIFAWLKDANNDKNKGLYVDKQDDKWITPQKTTKDKYIQDRKYTDAIFNYISGVEDVIIRAREK